MATAKYGQIKQNIHNQEPFKAIYNPTGTTPEERVLCPHVIGHRVRHSSSNPEERVLCYQTSGPDSNVWRSFVLSSLNVTELHPNPPVQWVTPVDYNQFQSNIHEVDPDGFVPYP